MKRKFKRLTAVMTAFVMTLSLAPVTNSIKAADTYTVTARGTCASYYGFTATSYFDVNGSYGYCMDQSKPTPDTVTGSVGLWEAFGDANKINAVKKWIYYGYGGPGQTAGIEACGNVSSDEYLMITHLALSEIYTGTDTNVTKVDTATAAIMSLPVAWVEGDYGFNKTVNSNLTVNFENADGDGNGVADCRVSDEITLYNDSITLDSIPTGVDAQVRLPEGWVSATTADRTASISAGTTFRFVANLTCECTYSKSTDSKTRIGNVNIYNIGQSTQPIITSEWQTVNSSFSFSLRSTEESRVRIKKVSDADCSYVNGNPLYSLAGAEYTIYTDASCTQIARDTSGNNAVLTTDADGNTPEIYMAEGDYVVKETKASPGYTLDTTVKALSVTKTDVLGNLITEPFVVTSTEVPIGDPVHIEITKQDSEGNIVTGTSLEGAVFEVAYYTGYYNTASAAAGNTAAAKWYLTTKKDSLTGKYIADLHPDFLASGYASSSFYTNSAGAVFLPLGTVTIKEVKAPDGYSTTGNTLTSAGGVCPNETFIGHIKGADITGDGEIDTAFIYTDNGSGAYNIKADKASETVGITVDETPVRTDFSLAKKNFETGETMSDVFFKVTSAEGEVHYVKTSEDGTYSSDRTANTVYTNYYDRLFDNITANDRLPDGTYIGDIDCGLWFYGTADTSQQDVSEVDASKGALRLGTYTLTEMVTTDNEDMQLAESITFEAESSTKVNIGTILNVPGPYITSVEKDNATETHISSSEDGIVNITDTVTYNYLTAGATYTLKGILMEKLEDGSIKPFEDAAGELVTSIKTFTVDGSYMSDKNEKAGSVDMEFSFKGENLAGRTFVIYQYLYKGTEADSLRVDADGNVIEGNIYIKHDNPDDIEQTGFFPEIQTTASDGVTGTYDGTRRETVKIVDTVSYDNLVVGKEYTIKGILMDKENEEPYLVNDNEIVIQRTFIATSSSGEIDMTFLFNGESVAGKGIVVFESLYYKDILLTTHSDINDEGQTVYYRPDNILLVDIHLIKQDSVNKKTLLGAEFILYRYNSDLVSKEDYMLYGEKIKSGLTDERGELIFEELQMEKYIIVESKAPDGYTATDNVLLIDVKGEGIEKLDNKIIYEKIVYNDIEENVLGASYSVPITGDENVNCIIVLSMLSLVCMLYIKIRKTNSK